MSGRGVTGCALLAAAFMAAFAGGCGPDSIGLGSTCKMSLISNQENTLFEVRPVGGEWREAGRGKIVSATVHKSQPCEIRAKAPGYIEKSMTLGEPVREVYVVFEIGDKENTGRIVVAAKAISVATGRVDASAAEVARDSSAVFESVGKCAAALNAQGTLGGAKVAVLTFDASGAAPGMGQVCRDTLVARLAAGGKVTIVERSELNMIIGERDLRLSGLVGGDSKPGRISGVDYIIVGSIAVSRE